MGSRRVRYVGVLTAVAVAVTLSGCSGTGASGPSLDDAVVPQVSGSSGGSAPIQNAPCADGTSGMTISLVNNTGRSDSEVYWYLQQQPAGYIYPELVAGPFTMAAKESISCSALTAGAIYFTLGGSGSVGSPQPHVDDPKKQAQYSAPAILWETKRFQTVELTYPGMANLTAVDMIGAPVDMATSGGDRRVFTCYTDKLQSALKKTLDATPGASYSNIVVTNNGQFVRLLSPNINPGTPGYPTFDVYLKSLAGTTLRIKATRGVHYAQYTYDYSGTVAADGSIVLTSTAAAAPNQTVTIPAGSLTGNTGAPDTTGIYGNNSPYYLGSDKTTAHHVGENDAYAAVYRDLVAGFDYGFWRKGGPNDSSAFNTSTSPGPFAGSQPSNPSFYNAWAAALWPATQAYGFAFEDTYTLGSRHPLMELPSGTTLTLTLQPDVTPPGRACG
ncbi:MAG: beta-1,3-glucanase family protein [Actinomycetes bacterium]